ncbi:MAG: tetratricopeptide repeat protein [Pseudomonadota bacterium]
MKSFLNAFVVMLLVFNSNAVMADGGGTKYSDSPLNSVYELIEDEQYTKALSELNSMEDKDADVFNLIGFSNRKLKNYDEALRYYQKALDLEPQHKAANEYLGQLYLETGKLDKAEERLAVLDDACLFSCDEYRSLKRAIKKYKSEN